MPGVAQQVRRCSAQVRDGGRRGANGSGRGRGREAEFSAGGRAVSMDARLLLLLHAAVAQLMDTEFGFCAVWLVGMLELDCDMGKGLGGNLSNCGANSRCSAS